MNDVTLVHYTVTEDYFQPQKAFFYKDRREDDDSNFKIESKFVLLIMFLGALSTLPLLNMLKMFSLT